MSLFSSSVGNIFFSSKSVFGSLTVKIFVFSAVLFVVVEVNGVIVVSKFAHVSVSVAVVEILLSIPFVAAAGSSSVN